MAAYAYRRHWWLLSRNRSPAFSTGASHGGCRDALFIQDHTRCLRRLVTTVGRDRGDAVPVRNNRTRARARITLQRIVARWRGSVVDAHRSSTAHVLCRPVSHVVESANDRASSGGRRCAKGDSSVRIARAWGRCRLWPVLLSDSANRPGRSARDSRRRALRPGRLPVPVRRPSDTLQSRAVRIATRWPLRLSPRLAVADDPMFVR